MTPRKRPAKKKSGGGVMWRWLDDVEELSRVDEILRPLAARPSGSWPRSERAARQPRRAQLLPVAGDPGRVRLRHPGHGSVGRRVVDPSRVDGADEVHRVGDDQALPADLC